MANHNSATQPSYFQQLQSPNNEINNSNLNTQSFNQSIYNSNIDQTHPTIQPITNQRHQSPNIQMIPPNTSILPRNMPP